MSEDEARRRRRALRLWYASLCLTWLAGVLAGRYGG